MKQRSSTAASRIRITQVQVLPDSLWNGSGSARRSTELTPLYIEHFIGLRTTRTKGFHDFWELICNRGAPGFLDADNRVTPLHQHHLVLLPPQTIHMEYSDHKMDIIWIGLRGKFLNAPGSADLLQARSQALSDAVERAWLFSRQGAGDIGPELDGMTRVLLGHLQRLASGGTRESANDLVSRAIRSIHERLAEPLFVADLAHSLGCSEGHLHRLFRQGTGMPPMEYLARARIDHSMRLLNDTHWPIAQIAELTGYADPFYFSRVFKKLTGISPATYRKTGK